MLPPSERGQDPIREELEHGLTAEPSHPLTDTEKEAAEHDPGRAERVYAPASERTPKPPAPGDRALVEGGMAAHREEAQAGSAAPSSQEPSQGRTKGITLGVGAGSLAAAGAVGGAWLYRRWQRERNRPINRLRRQARRAAAQPAWPAGSLGAALVLAALLGRLPRARATSDR